MARQPRVAVVRKHSLSDPDDAVAIFTESVEEDIRNLDATKSRAALNAIVTCLESPAPESVVEKPYRTCEELEQLRQGNLRLYVKLVSDLPAYDVLWVFAIRKHRYRNLGKFDAEACRKVADLRTLTATEAVDRYLADVEALTLAELRALQEEL